MISTRLRNLAMFFREKAATGGVTLDADKCELVFGQLDVCAEAAAIMEDAPVPTAPASVGHIADNIVRLADIRRARDVRAAGGDWGAA